MIPPTSEEFVPLLRDQEDVAAWGALQHVAPRSAFGRSPLSQYLMGVVGGLLALLFWYWSVTVVVSKVADEQHAFVSAMWGFMAASGILALYGFGSGAARSSEGVARVGRWWLVFERGLVILKNGRIEWSGPLSVLHATSTAELDDTFRLYDDTGRKLPLPLQSENDLVREVMAQAKFAAAGGVSSSEEYPYALALASPLLFGDDMIYRIYPDVDRLLMIYAGPFVPSKLNLSSYNPLRRIPGLIGLLSIFWLWFLYWRRGIEFDRRARYLDVLSREQLRAETKYNSVSTSMGLDNSSDQKLKLFVRTTEETQRDPSIGELTFHQKGSVTMSLYQMEDFALLAKAMARIIGPAAVILPTDPSTSTREQG